MGLLTSTPPPWHPAPSDLRGICQQADHYCRLQGSELATIALHHGFHIKSQEIPVVIGFSTLDEVHKAIWILSRHTNKEDMLLSLEQVVKEMYNESGYGGWSWASPP